jgi:hypothetical protein
MLGAVSVGCWADWEEHADVVANIIRNVYSKATIILDQKYKQKRPALAAVDPNASQVRYLGNAKRTWVAS